MSPTEAAEYIKEEHTIVHKLFPNSQSWTGVDFPGIPPLPVALETFPAADSTENKHFHPKLQLAFDMEPVERSSLDLKEKGTFHHSFNVKFLGLKNKANTGQSPDFTKVAPGQSLSAFGAMGFIEIERGGPDSNISTDHQGQVMNYNLRLGYMQRGRAYVASVLTNLHKAMLIVSYFPRDAEPYTVKSPSLPVYRNEGTKLVQSSGWALLHEFVRATPEVLNWPFAHLGKVSSGAYSGKKINCTGYLGAGRTSTVFSGSVEGEPTSVAVKIVNNCEAFKHEMEILEAIGKLKAPSPLPKLVGASGSTIITEPLAAPMKGKSQLLATGIKTYVAEFRVWHVQQLVDSLWWMFENGLQHRDLEPRHIAVAKDGSEVALLDFGFATFGKCAKSKPRSPGSFSCAYSTEFEVSII